MTIASGYHWGEGAQVVFHVAGRWTLFAATEEGSRTPLALCNDANIFRFRCVVINSELTEACRKGIDETGTSARGADGPRSLGTWGS